MGWNRKSYCRLDQAFRFSADVKDANTLHVDWQIATGYYLYRDRFKFALLDSPDVELGVIDMAHGQIKQEEDVPVEVFHSEVSFDLPLKRSHQNPATFFYMRNIKVARKRAFAILR